MVLEQIDRLFRTGTAAGLSDAHLLERFVLGHDEGAESAFSVLVERHGPMVLAVCRRVLNDPHDAQDAFQATFLVLVRNAGTVRKRESIADWLHGVARRVSARARADLARRRSVEREAATRSVPAYQPPAPVIDARDEVEYLPHDLRAVVVLCYLEGLTHDQAARRLGWPVGTVRSRLARARALLRADLTRRGTAPDTALLPMLTFSKTSLPEGLIDATVRAAILLSARDAGEAGLVSASAVALTEGVLRTMLVSKFKVTAVILIAVGALTSGVGLRAYQGVESGASPKAVESGPVPGVPPETPRASDVSSMRSAEKLIVYAELMEKLAHRVRQEQDEGDWDGAARDMRKSVDVAGEWQEEFMKSRNEKPVPPVPPIPVELATVSVHSAAEKVGTNAARSAECRLADLESKVDRLLHALEKTGPDHTERPKSAVPDQKPSERPR